MPTDPAFRSYLDCADAFSSLVAAIPDDHWHRTGLGAWSVRTLVGHTARSLDTVTNYLHDAEPEKLDTPTAVDYYVTMTTGDGPLAAGADASAIDARAVAAGLALGDDPPAAVSAKVAAASLALSTVSPDRRLAVLMGLTMPLAEYLRTRVFELVVHTLDISRATRVEHRLPTSAVTEMTHLAVDIAAATDRTESVLAALTGRAVLASGFSVV